MMVGRSPRALTLLVLLLPSMAAARPADDAPLSRDSLEALRAADLRLATIGYRLARGNVALCRDKTPTPGWVLHAIGQYAPQERANARAVFGFDTPVAVEAVVPGSAAAIAGVRANDSLLAIAGDPVAVSPPGEKSSAASRDAVLALIAARPADIPLVVETQHGGATRTATIAASPGCRTSFELLLGPDMTAEADGRIVQIGVRFLERYPDDLVAAVVAHELAHNILRHRARLDAAGVKSGVLAELGRNGRLFRQSESEADQLSVSLLYNAGYDPTVSVRFWSTHGGDVDGGLFRSRTHPASSVRAKAIAAEIATIPKGTAKPYLPAILAVRDQAMD